MMGAERKSMVMDENEKKLTAYHEAGHAIVGLNVPDHDPVYKVTIIPRGRALGVTMFLPEADRYSTSKRRLESRIATLFGGRVAEEMIFGPRVRHDRRIERHRARHRDRAQHGHEVGPLGQARPADVRGRRGRGVPRPQRHAAQAGVGRHGARRSTRKIRVAHRQQLPAGARTSSTRDIDKLHKMAEALIKYETIDERQIADIMAGSRPEAAGGLGRPRRRHAGEQQAARAPRRRRRRADGHPGAAALTLRSQASDDDTPRTAGALSFWSTGGLWCDGRRRPCGARHGAASRRTQRHCAVRWPDAARWPASLASVGIGRQPSNESQTRGCDVEPGSAASEAQAPALSRGHAPRAQSRCAHRHGRPDADRPLERRRRSRVRAPGARTRVERPLVDLLVPGERAREVERAVAGPRGTSDRLAARGASRCAPTAR